MSTHSALYITPDLQRLHLAGPNGDAEWQAPPLTTNPESAPTAAQWADRARAAADWLGQQRGVRRSLGAVVIDPMESVCLWVRSSSMASPVVAAAVRELTADWGDSAASLSVEPLVRPAAETGPFAFPAICHHDALVRIFLDALDKRGIVPEAVLSAWHVLPALDAARPGVCCTILHEESSAGGRLIWSWHEGGRTLAAGTAACGSLEGERAPERADAAMQRLSLDWVTWAAQLGTSPERMSAAGPGAGALVDAWGRRGADLPASVIETSGDALEAALLDAAQRASASAEAGWARNPSAVLARVSTRPTRRVRKRYQLAAGSALLFGLAVGSAAFRMISTSESWRTEAAQQRTEVRASAEAHWPGRLSARGEGLAREVRQLLDEEREQDGPALPARPLPIFEEIERVLMLVNASRIETRPEDLEVPEGGQDPWIVRLTGLQFTESGTSLSLVVPTREVGTDISQRLSADGRFVNWRLVTGGPSGAGTPRFSGQWIR